MVIVEGKLHGKMRPRFARGHAFNPPANRKYEDWIILNYKTQCNKYLSGAIRAVIIAYYKIPKSYSKKRIANIKAGNEYPTEKPDIDNLCKSLLDALNGIAYDDDRQITELSMLKRWTEGPERLEFELLEV